MSMEIIKGKTYDAFRIKHGGEENTITLDRSIFLRSEADISGMVRKCTSL